MPITNNNPGVVPSLVVAALERYQADWDALIDGWFDRGRCRQVNAELEEIRKLVCALPHLDIMEVVMRHAQLLRALVIAGVDQPRSAQVLALRRKLLAAIEAVRSQCTAWQAAGA